MIYVAVISICAVIVQGMVIHSLLRFMRASMREAQRREAELLNRLMYMAKMPWAEPPIERETEIVRPEEPVLWPEAVMLEN